MHASVGSDGVCDNNLASGFYPQFLSLIRSRLHERSLGSLDRCLTQKVENWFLSLPPYITDASLPRHIFHTRSAAPKRPIYHGAWYGKGKVSLDRSDINIQTLSALDHLLHISAPASPRRLTAANLEAGGWRPLRPALNPFSPSNSRPNSWAI